MSFMTPEKKTVQALCWQLSLGIVLPLVFQCNTDEHEILVSSTVLPLHY